MSHFQHRHGVPNSPAFRFCERKENHTSKFSIASLCTFLFYNIYNFVVFFPCLNFHYFDVLPLEFILFATLLILFHHFFLTSHRFPPWKRFEISKHTHVLVQRKQWQTSWLLAWMVSAKKKQMSEAQLLKAKQAKLKENEKMLGKFTHSSNKLIFPT